MWLLLSALACVAPTTPPGPADVLDTALPATEEVHGVLSLNLHCLKLSGTAFTDNASRMEAVAVESVARSVETLAVQEACSDGVVDAVELLAAALERESGEVWSHVWTPTHVAWEGTSDEAQEGVAILHRGALGESWVVSYAAQGALSRKALGVELSDGTHCYSIHLDHEDPDVRLRQSRETVTHALGRAAPGLDLIIAGDLNGDATSPAYATFGAMGFIDASATLPENVIDRIFVHRGAGWGPGEAELLFEHDNVVSDHPAVWVGLGPQVPGDLVLTRIVAEVDVGWGHWLTIRGDTAPLSWDIGWPAYAVSDAEWMLVLTEIGVPFSYKLLLDDETWQIGDDNEGMPGVDNDLTPIWE